MYVDLDMKAIFSSGQISDINCPGGYSAAASASHQLDQKRGLAPLELLVT